MQNLCKLSRVNGKSRASLLNHSGLGWLSLGGSDGYSVLTTLLPAECDMEFAVPLLPATLLQRYKRFLADAVTPTGETLTLHCPNTGRMTGCAGAGWSIWYSLSDNPKRKHAATWELSVSEAGHWIGVNTARANGLVAEVLLGPLFPELAGYHQLLREQPYGEEGSRIDLLARGEDCRDCYIEVKSVTLLGEQGLGYFPDAPSVRGVKHLRELTRLARAGQPAVLLFCVQHSGIQAVAPAAHIDPDYAKALVEAVAAGVAVWALGCEISPQAVRGVRRLPVRLNKESGAC